MSCLLVLLCCAGTLAVAWPQPSKVYYDIADAERHFNEFIITYDKQYANDEERDNRFQIFKENLQVVNNKNGEDDLAIFGMTKFSDLTAEEFRQQYTGYYHTGNSNCRSTTLGEEERISLEAPEFLDWRQKGKVTEVKDQTNCASCWAFATTGNLEGQYAIKHNKLVEFSEQQLVDCINKSCGGSTISGTIESLIEQNEGVMLESAYPYTGTFDTCKYDSSKVAVKITGCYLYDVKSEEELKQVLASVGPLAIAVASQAFQTYDGGILKKCLGEVEHGVLLVGYGTEDGVPYWIIKNSWGADWGEHGYVRVLRGNNTCNIIAGEKVSAEIA